MNRNKDTSEESRETQMNPLESRETQMNPLEYISERNNILKLTKEFNEKFFNLTRKSIDITNLSIMKDDIKNYRPLTEIQLQQLEDLTEKEKIELIKTYNTMFKSIKDLIN